MKSFKVTIFLAAILYAAPAFGHSALVSANPAADATLLEVPSEVRLEFNEDLLLVGELNPNRLEVFDANQGLVSGPVVVEKQFIIVPIDSETPPGTFTVKYRVTSGDGHPIEDEYQFEVASPEVISAPVEDLPEEDGPNLLIRVIWGLLAISAVGTVLLLRRR